jgi:hypothetical protein
MLLEEERRSQTGYSAADNRDLAIGGRAQR